MNVFEDQNVFLEELARVREEGRQVGLVVTKGNLHEGNISLILRAKDNCDCVVVSIMSGGGNFERDKKICKVCGIDILFVSGQDIEAMIDLVRPDKVFFGQKDYKKFFMLNKPDNIKFEFCPTVRDDDGVAVSSQNRKLSLESRKKAGLIYEALSMAGDMFEWGEVSTDVIRVKMMEILENEQGIRVECLEFLDLETLKPVISIDGSILIDIVVFVDDIRLEDNIILKFDLSRIE